MELGKPRVALPPLEGDRAVDPSQQGGLCFAFALPLTTLVALEVDLSGI